MAKHGTIFKGDFNISEQTKNFIDRFNLKDLETFGKYVGCDNWNYLHDNERDVVYSIPKSENKGSISVFGNMKHLQETYEILDNNLKYLKAKEVIAVDLFKEGKITRPECLRHEVDLFISEDSGAINLL